MKKLLLTLFTLLSLQVFAQNSDLDRTWFLTSLKMGGENIAIPADTYPTLSIDSEGSIYEGIGGCNSYEGAVDVSSITELSILDISYTLLMCESIEQENFEGFYFDFLWDGQITDFQYEVSYTTQQELGVLTLAKDNGDVAVYGAFNPNPPEDLTMEGWYLEYFEQDGVAQNYPSVQPLQYNDKIQTFFITTDLDHNFLCLLGGGIYTAYEYFGELKIEAGGTYLLADDCGEDISINYDRAYYEQLELKTHTYEIIEEGQGRRMILTDDNGDRIFYENAFLSTDDFTKNTSISIYPNPVQNTLQIAGDISSIAQIKILNINGQVVYQNAFNPFIDVSKLIEGVYFIEMQSSYNTVIEKFIKK